jgi:hypothetical protein
LRTTVILFGLFTAIAKPLEIEGKWDAFLEWYAFSATFFMYSSLINIFHYKDSFVFENQ